VTAPRHRDPGERPSVAIWPVTAATSRGYTSPSRMRDSCSCSSTRRSSAKACVRS